MRRYVGYALITIAVLTGILWGVSRFVQPILPTYYNDNLILLIGIVVGVVGLLAQLKDVVELFHPGSESRKQQINQQRDDFSITGPVQIYYGSVTNITQNITYLVSSQDRGIVPFSDTRTEPHLQDRVILPVPRQTPFLPREFVGRYQEITVLKQILLMQSNKNTVTGLIGMGGIGKTTLATAVAHDPEIERAFPDGTLWASLYESGHTKTILIDWIKALGYLGAFENLEEERLYGIFQTLVRKRRMLVIIDGADKNRISNLNTFLKTLENALAPESKVLITSREIDLPGAQNLLSLDLLPAADAVKLLERNIGQTFTSDEKAIASEIVFLLGYHPLAITVSAGWLSSKQEALTEFRDGLRDRLEAGTGTSLDDVRNKSIKRALDLSYSYLSRIEQSRFRALSVFAPREHFNSAAASVVWNMSHRAAQNTLTRLADRGLVVVNEEDYNLHPLIESYLKDLMASETRKEVFETARRAYGEYLKTKNSKRRS